MAATVQRGRVQISTLTATSTHSASLSGFSTAPNLIFVFSVGRDETADAIDQTTNIDGGWGVWTSVGTTRQRCQGTGYADGVTEVRGHMATRVGAVIELLQHVTTSGGASDGYIEISAVSSTSITFRNVTAVGNAITLEYLAIYDATITAVHLGSFACAAATGNQSVTGLSSQPEIVFLWSSYSSGGDTIIVQDSLFNLGVATSSSSQYVISNRIDHGNVAVLARTYCRAGECLAVQDTSATGFGIRSTFVSMNGDGFTVNHSVVTSNRLIQYLAITGGDWGLFSFTAPSTNGGGATVSGLAFRPASAFLVSAQSAADAAATLRTNLALSMGAAVNGGDHGVQAWHDGAGNAAMDPTSALDVDEDFLRVSGGAVAAAGKINSWASDGFTWSQTIGDASQSFIWGVAIGEAAAPGGGSFQPAWAARSTITLQPGIAA